RIRGLAEGHEDLIDVRIVGQTTRHHRHGGSEVHLSCQARGQEIVAKLPGPRPGDRRQALAR
ncbi:MAG: hypothetical protein V3R91_03605, partial [Myxococcota bacterium]